jgi:hypothetical protein
VKPQIYAFRWLFCLSLAVGAGRVDFAYGQAKAADSDVRVTVIGCVQRSQPLAVEAPGTTVILAGETKYVLGNITLVPPSDRRGAAAAGSIGNLVAASVNMYRLDDSADSLIAPHVGERVQVTGTIVQPSARPKGTAGQTESPTTESNRAPTLRVESLQKTSSDSTVCSR